MSVTSDKLRLEAKAFAEHIPYPTQVLMLAGAAAIDAQAAEVARLRGSLKEVLDIYERNAGGDYDAWEYSQWMEREARQALEPSDA